MVEIATRSHRGGRTLVVIAAMIAIVFGLLTIWSAGQALFGSAAARAAVGKAVDFVLWFNFAAGFAYVAAGIGLILRQRWTVSLSILIAAATVLVFAALGVHVLRSGAYEMRTVGAMVLRSLVWIGIAAIAWRGLRTTQG